MFQFQLVISNNLVFFPLSLTHSHTDMHTNTLLFFMLYFGVESIIAFLFLAAAFKTLLAAYCSYGQSNGIVRMFATAQYFVKQLKDKYVFIFPIFISAKEW